MPAQGASGKPMTRRYIDDEKAQAVRLVRQLRAELGTEHGTIKRVADQLCYGVESVRGWVNKPGPTTVEAERVRALEQEVRELRRANATLKSASAFFAAELDCPSKRSSTISTATVASSESSRSAVSCRSLRARTTPPRSASSAVATGGA